MKKYILTLAAIALSFSFANAQNLYIDEVVEVPQGAIGKVAVKYETGGYELKALQFKLDLPAGITVGTNSDDETYEILDAKASKFSVTYANNGWNAFSASTAFSADTEGKGTFMNIFLAADASLEIGTTHEVTVKGPMVSRVVDGASQAYYLDDFTFTVKIVENRVALDENSTEAPEEAENVNIKVLRTIKANNWSTICLPFTASADQLSAAFSEACGEEVQVELADFAGYEIEENDDGEIVAITVNFSSISELPANHPCIIKATADISEFKLDNITITPSDALEINLGSKRAPKKIVGTYVADFDFFNEAKFTPLFLSGNKFWYASESTKHMKAFRAYFEFADELENFDVAGVKMQIDGVFDGINGINIANAAEGVFTIDGKKINNTNRLPKGVYIIDGKKVAIK